VDLVSSRESKTKEFKDNDSMIVIMRFDWK